MAARSIATTARELILQEELAKRAAAVPEEQRREARAHLELARARHLAGESLAARGEHSEAARAFNEAIAATLGAAALIESDDVRAAEKAAREVAAEADAVSHSTFLADAARAHQKLYEAVAPYTLDTRSLRRAQIRRAAAIFLYAIIGVMLAVLIVRRGSTLTAEASGSFNATYFASKAVDNDPNSEWLLPDRATGWIDVEISPPRAVRIVRLLNARNVPYNDRATGEFRVESSLKGAPLAGVDGAFPGFSAAPMWRDVTLDGQTVDHIKVFVRSFHEAGGGFAEITIE